MSSTNTYFEAEWVRRIGGSSNELPSSTCATALDSSNNLYATFEFNSYPTTIFAADGTNVSFNSTGGVDAAIVKYDPSGVMQWYRRIGGSTNDKITGITVNKTDNSIYVSGTYASHPLKIYRSNNTTSIDLSNISNGTTTTDAFVAKYDSSGEVQWARRLGGSTSNDAASAITLDNTGNIYVTGQYNSNPFTVFNTNNTDSYVNLSNTSGNTVTSDVYIAQYNSLGEPQWARRIGGISGEIATSIASDGTNVYVTGTYLSSSGGALNIYGTDNITPFTTLPNPAANNQTDIFIVKYNSVGEPQWVRRISGNVNETPNEITADANGNLFIAGTFTGSGGTGTAAALVVYNANGNTSGNSAALTLSNAGTSGTNDVFLVKYDSTGTPTWARRVGGNLGADIGFAVKTDLSGNIYMLSQFASNPLQIYDTNNTTIKYYVPVSGNVTSSSNNIDTVLIKYNSAGSPIGYQTIAGPGNDFPNGLSIDTVNNIYITGRYGGTLGNKVTIYTDDRNNFFNRTPAFDISNATGTNSDMYIVKYKQTTRQLHDILPDTGTVRLSAYLDRFYNGAYTPTEKSTILSYIKTNMSKFTSLVDDIGGQVATNYVGLGASATMYNGQTYNISMYNKVAIIANNQTVDLSNTELLKPYNKKELCIFGSTNDTVTIRINNTDYMLTITTSGVNGAIIYNGQTYVLNDSITFGNYKFTILYHHPNVIIGGQFEYIQQSAIGNYLEAVYAKTVGDMNADDVNSIAYDSQNNIYITGYIQINTTNLECFLRKYDSSGNEQWRRRVVDVTSTAFQTGKSVTVDSSDNVYLAVAYQSSTITVYAGEGINESTYTTLTNTNALYDTAIIKYDSTGSPQWACNIGGTGSEEILSIKTDKNNDLYVIGQFGSTNLNIFNANTSKFTDISNLNTNNDIFVVKYDTNGSAKWARRIGSIGNDYTTNMVIDSQNNIYICVYGNSQNILLFGADHTSILYQLNQNAGVIDAYIMKYNSQGTAQWIRRVGGIGSDYVYGIDVDSKDNVYISGICSSTLNVYTSDNTTIAYTITGSSGFIIKYTSEGTAQWARRIGGTGITMGNSYIKIDSQDNIFVTSQYISSGGLNLNTFLPNHTTAEISIPTASSVYNDVCIIKYNSSGVSQSIHTIKGTNNDSIKNITIDKQNNIYVTGTFMSSTLNVLAYDNSSILQSTNLTAGSSGGTNDIYIVKYKQLQPYELLGLPVSLSNYFNNNNVNKFATSTTDRNMLKQYIKNNKSKLTSYIADISGSSITNLIEQKAAGYDETLKSKIGIFMDGQTVDLSSYTTSFKNNDKELYLYGVSGDQVTLQLDGNNYTLTVLDNGAIYNGTTYTLGQTIPLGNYRFNMQFVGSAGGTIDYDASGEGYAVGITGVANNNPYTTTTSYAYTSFNAGYNAGKALYDIGYPVGYPVGVENGTKSNNYTIGTGQYNGYEGGYTAGLLTREAAKQTGYQHRMNNVSKDTTAYAASAYSTALQPLYNTSYDLVDAFLAGKADGANIASKNAAYNSPANINTAYNIGYSNGLPSITAQYNNQLPADNNQMVVTWGSSSGGDSSAVASQLTSGVTAIYPNDGAFAALKQGGQVVTWGNATDGGNSSTVSGELLSGVTAIYSTNNAFAALKPGGKVVTWGNSSNGGSMTSPVNAATQLTSGVTTIYSTNYGGFAALKAGGQVVTWGSSTNGGNSSAVASQLSSGVQKIYSTYQAFAALKSDGSVVAWGDVSSGGSTTSPINVASQLTSGVIYICAAEHAFAALKSDGSVVAWGGGGGDSSAVAMKLLSDVVMVHSVGGAFAALKSDGSVVTWGGPSGGDSSAVASKIKSNVYKIYSNSGGFVALKSDTSIVTWGWSTNGGNMSSPVNAAAKLTSGVLDVVRGHYAFAALKVGGEVVSWGPIVEGGDSSGVTQDISSGVIALYSNIRTFAALKSGGKVVTWGKSTEGGDSSTVASQISTGVTRIYASGSAYAAVKPVYAVIPANNTMSFGTYLNSIITHVTPSNLTAIKQYVKTSASYLSTLVDEISGSVLTNFITQKDVSYNETLKEKVTIVANNQQVNLAPYKTALLNNEKELHIYGASGEHVTLQLDSTNYTIRLRDDGAVYNNTFYTLNQTIPLGSYNYTINALGSVIGSLTVANNQQQTYNGVVTPTTPQYDLSYNPVEIIIPITIDSSGGVVELFGSEATRVAYQLRLMTDVSATTLYDQTDGSGVLEYIEASGDLVGPTTDDLRRDALDVRFNNLTPKGRALATSFATALHYSLTHSIDASAVYAAYTAADQTYESFGDFVVSFIAQQVFGHPRATAAISNDISIMTRLNATYPISDTLWGSGLNNSTPSGSIVIRLLQALRNLSDEDELDATTTTRYNLQGRDALRSIVTQMMLQDPARFRVERSELQWLGLEFRPADTLVFNIKLQGFSFNIDGKTGKGGVYADGYAPQIAPTEFSIIFKLC